MGKQIVAILLLFSLAAGLAGCAGSSYNKLGPTPMIQAQEEIPPEQLLDVGIEVFTSDELTEEKAEKEGTHPDIRKSESHFIPYHLKNTLNKSSYWGAVSVLPAQSDSVDLLIKGKIIESNGEDLTVKIDVVDATGKTWLNKTYSARASEFSYSDSQPGDDDVYQDIYNAIANDIATYRLSLAPKKIETIRTVSELQFAEELAPKPFSGYLTTDSNQIKKINRLPADEDPMMERLLKIRARENMYVDTLNEYYGKFYREMWPSYHDWRKMSLTERLAMRKIRKEAALRQIAGALLVAGAIAMAVEDVPYTGALQVGMMIIGGQVIVDGFNVSKQAEIHGSAIKELSESFAGEMRPVVLEFEGKQYELTGSVEEQFKKWRELMRKIYYAETGFDPDESTDEMK